MGERSEDTMPREMASAVNLMAHPLAGAAALSAVGLGVASQALGLWIGALTGVAEASERLLKGAFEAGEGGTPSKTSAKVRARAKRVMEDAQSVAREVGMTAGSAEAARRTTAPTARARSATAKAAPAAQAPVDRAAAGLRRPRGVDRPSVPDDLKAIAGIGPKLEQVLNGLGVWTYAQIADWSEREIAWVEEHLGFRGRIGRDGWIGQAAKLAGRAGAAG